MKHQENIYYKTSSGIRAALENVQCHPFHIHEDTIEIICVLDGEIDISDCASDYKLRYGDIYIFNPRDPHKLHSDKDNILLTIQISQKHYSNYFEALTNAYFICDSFTHKTNFSSDLANLRFLLASLYFEYSKKMYSDISLESLTNELLNILLEDFQHYKYMPISTGGFEIIRQTKDLPTNSTNSRVYKIIDFIGENYRKKLKLEDMAEMEYLSASHLSRCIKQVSGMTFSQLLSLTRCEEAERLLCYTKKTVDAIANEVGYATRKELATNFNKWYQKNPSAFRNDLIANVEKGKTCNTFDYDFALVILNTYLDGY